MRIDDFAKALSPRNTVLLFGSGSSIPSGGPSVSTLIEHLSKSFGVPSDGYSLSEMASLCEAKTSRRKVVDELRGLFLKTSPTGGLTNLPLYPWKSIFTTNYDKLIESTYEARGKKLRVFHSNFNFTTGREDEDCILFKLHGTIDRDVVDGDNSRIILSESDYEQTERYRDFLYDRLRGDLAGADLVIIGQSLSDPDLKNIVNRAAALNSKAMMPGRIWLLMYARDDARASLFEQRGISVVFGGIDEFFAALTPSLDAPIKVASIGTHLERVPALAPVTLDVAHALGKPPEISAMFNGRSASYADIAAGYTFRRAVADEIAAYFEEDATLCAVLLGASGVGKATAARQAVGSLREKGFVGFEHLSDHSLNARHWFEVAECLKTEGEAGLLFIDDAHHHLLDVNDLVDNLVQADNAHLKILICSTRNHWHPRIKTPNIFKYGKQLALSRLSSTEIERLLVLLDTSPEVMKLVEDQFSGFNREERRRRLSVRCEADMFVCLKHIFANDNFDDIVLREYGALDKHLADIYRYVSALETAGVRVHRQLIVRLLGIEAGTIQSILDNLTDIVSEYNIDSSSGIYGWRTRHSVIAAIVAKYKFPDLDRTIDLFDSVIDNISPTYDIEIRSLRELCNVETGISRIPDKNVQNRLLRRMMSNAPGERVPRHRLIRNLIDQGYFEKAETEIRLFDKDFGSDGPVHRYKIKILIERATRSKGLLSEDRIAILEEAHELAVQGVNRYPINKNILSAYAELGIEYYRKTGQYTYFDEAITHLQVAEEKLGDPQISSLIAMFQRRIAGQPVLDLYEREAAILAD